MTGGHFFGGIITFHTTLSYEGDGLHLIALARNDSDAQFQDLRICVSSSALKEGCLFELSNRVLWARGAELRWDVTAARKPPDLSHGATLKEFNLVQRTAPATQSKASVRDSGGIVLGCIRTQDLYASGVWREADGVSPPTVIFKVDPEYSEEARKAKYNGTGVLSLIVDTDGRACDISVVSGSLGLGLDRKAIEAIQKWKFKPGELKGAPVNVRVQIEVIFPAWPREESRVRTLNVTVSGKSGQFIRTLPQSAFTVFENGLPQQIKDFKREDVPVSLGLIIDNSGSMREKRQTVVSSALAMVRDSNPQDEAFVVNFNDDAYLDVDFTGDLTQLARGLARNDSRGGRAMRDAVRMSIEHLNRKAKRHKKMLLVVTDGNDNASLVSLETLVREAQQNDVLIYAIGLPSNEDNREASKAKRALHILAESTGGQAFYPKTVNQVEGSAYEVAQVIKNQYTMTYAPTNPTLDGSFRQIQVAISGAGTPVVRTRLGYYAAH
jgi:VWFA-related protein/TonB family protein